MRLVDITPGSSMESTLVNRAEKKSLRHEAFQPCHEAWLMGGLG